MRSAFAEARSLRLNRASCAQPHRLSRINDSLARKVASRNEYDKTIMETEAAYMKILESSQVHRNSSVRSRAGQPLVLTLLFPCRCWCPLCPCVGAFSNQALYEMCSAVKARRVSLVSCLTAGRGMNRRCCTFSSAKA